MEVAIASGDQWSLKTEVPGQFTHQDEDHEVQDDIEGSASHEEFRNIEASSFHVRIHSFPSIAHWSTKFRQSIVVAMGKFYIPLEHDRDVNTNHVHNAHHRDPNENSPESHKGEDAVIEGQAEATLAMPTRCSMRRREPALTLKTSIAWSLCGRRARRRRMSATSFFPFWQVRSLVARYKYVVRTHWATLLGDS